MILIFHRTITDLAFDLVVVHPGTVMYCKQLKAQAHILAH